jgi:shikimate dehydrogenase
MQFVDEIDPITKKIKAVNTIINKNELLSAFNTDSSGAIKALEEKTKIQNKNILLLGAGGAARAISYNLIDKKANLTISNRTEEKAISLAKELNCSFKKLDEINWQEIDILINATSIGMSPKINKSPVEKSNLRNMIVFDSVYNPLVTKLLNDAERNNCQTISGLKMFIYQAAEQFRLWTNTEPDTKFMEKIILEHISQ